MVGDQERDDGNRQAFGAWMLAQKNRGGFVGELATATAGDLRFPRDGNITSARKCLQEQRASGDDWEALEDAKSAWMAL